jgi:hypothetical protein
MRKRSCVVQKGGQTDQVAERVQVRDIDDDEGRRLLRIIRRGTGSVVTCRRAQMALLSAQEMVVVPVPGDRRETALVEARMVTNLGVLEEE